jgi:molybdopterin synthase catalytic subunit
MKGRIVGVTVHVRLFAILKERAGTDRVELELPETATVADALAALARLPGLEALASGSARLAVNREYATPQTLVTSTDELALIPPVSGGDALAQATVGTRSLHASVTHNRIDHEPLIERVQDAHAGAVVTFAGYPRDIPALEYEAYAEMAAERIVAILTETQHRHGLTAAAAEHRVGAVPAFEASIIVAVSAPHREAAFAGAREILDRIKAEAPIWKVELAADGSRTRIEGVLPQ